MWFISPLELKLVKLLIKRLLLGHTPKKNISDVLNYELTAVENYFNIYLIQEH